MFFVHELWPDSVFIMMTATRKKTIILKKKIEFLSNTFFIMTSNPRQKEMLTKTRFANQLIHIINKLNVKMFHYTLHKVIKTTKMFEFFQF